MTDHAAHSIDGVPAPPRLPETAAAVDDVYKAQLGAFLQEWNALQRDKPNQQVADRLTQLQVIQIIVQGYIQVSQTSLDRAVTRGTYVTTAAGAIATAYTALLAASYSSATGGTRLVAAALIPAIFLGLGIVFSVAYIAFLKQAETRGDLLSPGRRPHDTDQSGSLADLNAVLQQFCEWTYGGVRDRNGYLHLAVYSLAIGVVLLPVAFTELTQTTDWLLGLVGLLLLGVAALQLKQKKFFGVQGARVALPDAASPPPSQS